MIEVEKLAREFSSCLKKHLNTNHPESTKTLFHEMIEKHIELNAVNESFCVSHGYCDSNMVMIEAFKLILECEPDGMNDTHNSLINQAWTMAKQNNFYD